MTRVSVAFGAASLILAAMLDAVPSFAATTTSAGPARSASTLPAGVERVTSVSSRLATRVRQNEGLSYAIGSQLFTSPQDRVGRFFIYAIYAPQNVRKVEAAIHEELERALRDGFTTEEVRAATAGWLQSQQLSLAQDSELANRLASESYIGRTLAWDAKLEEDIKALNPDVIVTALRRHVDPAKLTIIEAGDFAESSP